MAYTPHEIYAVIRVGFDLSLVVPKYKLSETIDLLTDADFVDTQLKIRNFDGEELGFHIRFVKGFVLNKANDFEAPPKPSLFHKSEEDAE